MRERKTPNPDVNSVLWDDSTIRKILGWFGAYVTKMKFCNQGDMCYYNDANHIGTDHGFCLKEDECAFKKNKTVR